MKNIHLLETDKDSNLFIGGISGKLHYNYSIAKGNSKNQFIYITNEEILKINDWYFDGIDFAHKMSIHNDALVEGNKKAKKIILTNDTKLISDGVQEIDEEQLKEIVSKYPLDYIEINQEPIYKSTTYDQPDRIIGYKYSLFNSFFAEKTETLPQKKENLGYITKMGVEIPDEMVRAVMIPKERFGKKEEYSEWYNEKDDLLRSKILNNYLDNHKGTALTAEEVMEGRSSAYNFLDFKETAKEAAERLYPHATYENDHNALQNRKREDFLAGAKWREEKLYTEEEILKAQQAILGNIKDAVMNKNYIVEYLGNYK